MLERMQSRMAQNNVKYSLQLEDGIPPVDGDLRALEQVFTNLISNAIQAMPEGGTIVVKSRRQHGTEDREDVEISISDTGPGIPNEIRDRIFEPFFTTKPNGTGLGLAIVKRIVTAHKGSISVNSVPGGTVFQIHLPTSTPI
jgi:signal transduction histidine kinase